MASAQNADVLQHLIIDLLDQIHANVVSFKSVAIGYGGYLRRYLTLADI
jgi:hypothetical protein